MSWLVRFRRKIKWSTLDAFEKLAIADVLAHPSKRYLLVSEVRPTFTFGISALREELLWSEALLKEKNIEVHSALRGGRWTYHGPGQLVVFPIARITELGYGKREVKKYIFHLKKCIESFIASLGISLDSVTNLPFGIYVGGAKLVSFGVGITKNICHHGLALNITPQDFSGIIPCGVKAAKIISLHELGFKLSWREVANAVVHHIKNSFK